MKKGDKVCLKFNSLNVYTITKITKKGVFGKLNNEGKELLICVDYSLLEKIK